MEKLAALQLLVSAPSKGAVEKLFMLVFERRAGDFSAEELTAIKKKFNVEEEQLGKLLGGIRLLIRASLKKNATIEKLAEALPESIDKRLRVLVLKIIAAHVDGWREELEGQREEAPAPAPVQESPAPSPAKSSKRSAPAPEPEPEPEPQQEQEAPVLPPVLPPVMPEEPSSSSAPPPVLPPVLPPVMPEEPSSSSAPPPVLPPVMPAAQEKSTPQHKKTKSMRQQAPYLEAVGAQQSVPTATRKLGPSLPRFEGIDWRVDVRSASDTVSRMSVPTVLVQMRVQNSYNGEVPPAEGQAVAQRLVTFELNKETLATMLDGLVFVRDQLAAIAQ